jgi:protein-S-isoprenylcysteine O-methyltransferase Ste14
MHVVLLWSVFALIAFGLRTLVQLRTTGRTGWVALRHNLRPIERVAAALFTCSLGIAFAGALAAALGSDHPWLRPTELPVTARAAGGGLYVTGMLTTFVAQLAMGKSWRIGVDATERTDLVAHGLFRFVRNPIYTAMLVTVAGLTLLACSVVTCIGLLSLVVALELQVRAVEEPYLARTHGDAWSRYAARVGRFVPLLGRARLPTAGA